MGVWFDSTIHTKRDETCERELRFIIKTLLKREYYGFEYSVLYMFIYWNNHHLGQIYLASGRFDIRAGSH